MTLAHLYVDEDAVVRLVQDFVAFGLQWKLKRDLGSSRGKFSWFHHLHVAGHQLNGLKDRFNIIRRFISTELWTVSKQLHSDEQNQ